MKARGLTSDERAVLWMWCRTGPKAKRHSAAQAGKALDRSDRAIRGYLNGATQSSTRAAYDSVKAAGRLVEVEAAILARGAEPAGDTPSFVSPEPPVTTLAKLADVGRSVKDAAEDAIADVRRGVSIVTALVRNGVPREAAQKAIDHGSEYPAVVALLEQAHADHLAQLEQAAAAGGSDARVKLEILERRDPMRWRPRTDFDVTLRSVFSAIPSDELREHARAHAAED